ncbi:bacillithiol biosynthesis deacetylase BshB2 [Paenibacillus humicola]|uniref:bacillithiol biosynthesis deacetylase BshB2 n=1 Tax=Paenibacillus humicola TaxID=3110540 RepID=UPI00237AE287|nr:bacillithiol biosynthesis deacetylase BshB2 [Paenibacillus humicola]
MERRVLVVLPHPDDEAFGISGTLSKYVQEGASVTYACLTLGEMGRNMGFPPFASRVTLPSIRKQELEASCAAIGIRDLRMLGFHDKTVEFDRERLDSCMEELLSELKPTLVITFYPGYSVHPDHDATGASVIESIRKLPEADRPLVYCVAFARGHEEAIGKPDVIHDVRPFVQQKIASITSHRSQFQAVVGEMKLSQQEAEERFGTERFWTYTFA